jgi:hypothetical protein
MDDDLPALRARWLDLVRRVLPEAARKRSDWPIRLDHCFARVILDEICGRPWREVLPSPAYKHLDAAQLAAAISLGEAIACGSADLQALNRSSLQIRGKLIRARA